MRINYAWQFWRNPNLDNYRYYDDSDCTNFASQVLEAGGLPYFDGPRGAVASWYYGKFTFTTSYSWAAAQNLYDMLMVQGAGRNLASTGDLREGDLLFYAPPGGGAINHVQICTLTYGLEKYMTQHSTPYVDKPLSDILMESGNRKAIKYPVGIL